LGFDNTQRSYNRLNLISSEEKDANNLINYNSNDNNSNEIKNDKNSVSFCNNFEISNISENLKGSGCDLLANMHKNVRKNSNENSELKNIKKEKNYLYENICFIEQKKGFMHSKTSNSKEEEKDNLTKIEKKKTYEIGMVNSYL
jgi:hypothetical protein